MINFMVKQFREGPDGPLLISGTYRCLAGYCFVSASVLVRKGPEQSRSSTLPVPKQLRTKYGKAPKAPLVKGMQKPAK